MRAVIQRVARAEVRVAGQVVASIGRGYLVLLGVHRHDSEAEAEWLARKTASLRLFGGSSSKFELGLAEVGGQVLVVSQFTLYGDARKGRRPDFVEAAPAAHAERLYEHFAASLAACGVPVATGVFGAMMDVELVNDGPVTLIVEREPCVGAGA